MVGILSFKSKLPFKKALSGMQANRAQLFEASLA